MSNSCGISGSYNSLEQSDPVPNQRPVVIYDGDCGFCERWARIWKEKGHNRLDVIPYQALNKRLPKINPDNCARAVHLAEPTPTGVRITTASQAAIRSHLIASNRDPDRGIYAVGVPCMAVLLYLPYRLVARYRGFFNRLIFGRTPDEHAAKSKSNEPTQ